jgi:putative transcriptional regulator
MAIDASSSLQHHFLVAMPGLLDPNFYGALVYIAEHNSSGTVGLVVNRLLDMNTQALFEKIDLPLPEALASSGLGSAPVLDGGPVNTNRGFVLHSPEQRWAQTLECSDSVCLTSSRDILESVSRGEGPQRIAVALGYAGWSAGQLDQEIMNNAWLTIPADADILFDLQPAKRLESVLGRIGVNRAFLSSQAGHA